MQFARGRPIAPKPPAIPPPLPEPAPPNAVPPITCTCPLPDSVPTSTRIAPPDPPPLFANALIPACPFARRPPFRMTAPAWTAPPPPPPPPGWSHPPPPTPPHPHDPPPPEPTCRGSSSTP